MGNGRRHGQPHRTRGRASSRAAPPRRPAMLAPTGPGVCAATSSRSAGVSTSSRRGSPRRACGGRTIGGRSPPAGRRRRTRGRPRPRPRASARGNFSGRLAPRRTALSDHLGRVEMASGRSAPTGLAAGRVPAPTPEGVDAVGRAYADVGLRAVIAPMVADRTLYEAIPGCSTCSRRGAARRSRGATPGPVGREHRRPAGGAARLDARPRVRAAGRGADHSHHCFRRVHRACAIWPRSTAGAAQPRGRIPRCRRSSGCSATARRLDRAPGRPRPCSAALSPWPTRVARSGRHEAAGRPWPSSIAHNPGSNLRLGNGLADMKSMLEPPGERGHRHRRRQLLGQR